ncbi:MAG TPA: hypothetical protein VLI55_20540 [Bryobacteraceae bacterium]|nr:hypothetical protein [Bryobacteraceae bacterium]
MHKVTGLIILSVSLHAALWAADQPASRLVDQILQNYIQAVGGQAAIERIQTREVRGDRRHGPKLTYYWQKPNKVLLITKKERIGFDGSAGWVLSRKKHITKLAKGAQKPLEMDANPIRYVHLKTLYSEINTAPPEELDGTKMDVLVAPNDIGATKFYFDSSTHLLARIEETGETSAYYKQTTEFTDYKGVDGVRLPFRIIHLSTQPGVGPQDLRISKIEQNLELKPDIFSKPTGVVVVLGGKR